MERIPKQERVLSRPHGLVIDERTVTWFVWVIAAVWALVIAPVAGAQIYRLPNPDEAPGDFFGVSVDIEGSRAVVGASGAGLCGVNSGAAYVYEADSTTGHWNHVATLQPNNCMEGDFFGKSLAMSGDRILVAAFRPAGVAARSNAAYIFEIDPDTGKWVQKARFEGSSSEREGAFASAVGIDGDWALITTTGDAVSNRYHGAAYFFRRNQANGDWKLHQRVTPRHSSSLGVFGTSADLEKPTAVVGASTYLASVPGSLYMLQHDGSQDEWRITQRFGGIDDFFLPVDLLGSRIIVGERRAEEGGSGRATVFERNGDGLWQKAVRLKPASPFDLGAFGSEVSLGDRRALVVGFDEQLRFEFNIDRVVYVFDLLEDGRWQQRHIIDVGEVSFGSDVSTDGNVALIGETSDALPGTAYVVQIH